MRSHDLKPAGSRSRWLRFGALAATLLLCTVTAATAAWAALALAIAGPGTQPVRVGLAGTIAAFALAVVVIAGLSRWRWHAFAAYAVVFSAVLAWWSTIEPSNDRVWQADVAVLPYATIDGDRITVHNIRNFDYRSETDYTPAYYDRTFDLRELSGVDLYAVYWMGPAIAHIFVSFEFGDGQHLAVSIETRKEKGEDYSTIKGFFRQYEVFYVVADERDVVRLRTNYRKDPPEDVYLYRLQGPIENARRVFLAYVAQINKLKSEPAFYNTLLTNCTTSIWLHTRVNPDGIPLSWKVLASGYVPEYLYEAGRLDTRVEFADIVRNAHVNERARAADSDPEFSKLIRLPERAVSR